MKEIKGDLFKFQPDWDAICITTNGFVKSNGENVMGKGCAKQAANKYPQIPKLLGSLIKRHGNCVFHLSELDTDVAICTFPVKPVRRLFYDEQDVVKHMRGKFTTEQWVPGWASVAMPHMIQVSAQQLVDLTNSNGWNKVIVPRPGCGAGELNWEQDIKPLLESILDDRFYIIDFE